MVDNNSSEYSLQLSVDYGLRVRMGNIVNSSEYSSQFSVDYGLRVRMGNIVGREQIYNLT